MPRVKVDINFVLKVEVRSLSAARFLLCVCSRARTQTLADVIVCTVPKALESHLHFSRRHILATKVAAAANLFFVQLHDNNPLTRLACLLPRLQVFSAMPSPSWVQGRLAAEPAWSRFLYNTILKRSSTYMTAVMIVATTVGIGYDYAIVGFWNSHNKGVRTRSTLDLQAAWQPAATRSNSLLATAVAVPPTVSSLSASPLALLSSVAAADARCLHTLRARRNCGRTSRITTRRNESAPQGIDSSSMMLDV